MSGREPRWPEHEERTVQLCDLEPLIAATEPRYLAADAVASPFDARIHALAFARRDRRLYLVYADRFLFWSADGCRTLHEVAEINRLGRKLVPIGEQWLDAVVETITGTVLVIGRDRRDRSARGVVWRKPSGASSFERTVATDPAWATSKAGNATAGFFGAPPREMTAIAVYDSPAHLWFSVDDGRSWRRQPLDDVFALHAHEVYLGRAINAARVGRLWVTGGDDPSGEKSGIVCFERLGEDGSLAGRRHVLREKPGFRIVGVAGNGRHVFFGNESLAGGVLKLQDNAQSIELLDFECALGKNRHDYHQMRSMVATPDGVLVAGTDSYSFIGDNIRADSGGYVYVSTDEGASFREFGLAGKWVTAIAFDGSVFWIAFASGREEGADLSEHRLTLLRLPKPSPLAELTDPYCAKVVVADTSSFYRQAGYAAHPAPELAPGECTFRVDMSRYARVGVTIDTRGPARLAVESLPFLDWHPDEHRWMEVALLEFERAERRETLLPATSLARHYRVRNVGAASAPLRQVVFVGRR